MKFTIKHDAEANTFKLYDDKGVEVMSAANPNRLSERAFFHLGAKEVAHEYDLKLAEWRPL
jgi:hypothetical protein